MTRVSVVVPAYNNAEYIERTMDSILAQTHTDLQIIVADHASTDSTWELLQRYAADERVTLLKTEAGGGALRNWNRVSQEATEKYLKLVCGDDVIAPTLIERQVAALDGNPSATLSAVSRDIVDANDRPVIRNRGLGGMKGLVPGATAIRNTVTSGTNLFGEPACVMLRTDILKTVGWWDSSYPYLIDEATYVRVLLEGDLVAIDEPLASFRVSDSQWSVRLARSQASQAAGFHTWLFTNHSVISRADLRRGNLAALAMAGLRRAAYIVLRRRMKANERAAS